MRIIIITQDEPFYLAKNLSYLIKILPKHSEIVGCVVTDASPFGKKESFLKKAKQLAIMTIKISKPAVTYTLLVLKNFL